MDTLLRFAQQISPGAAGILITSVWESLVLTALVAVGLRLLRGLSAAARSIAWGALLVLLLLLPALVLLAPHHAGGQDAVHVASHWSLALVAAWAALSAYRGVRLGMGAFRLGRLALRARPVPAGTTVSALLHSGSRNAVLCVSADVNRPSVAGFFRPRVLLPEGLLETLSAKELECVVLHEMEHLRRFDDWLNLLQQISLVLLPLHPALLWLDRRLCRERELACDDRVLNATRAPRAYAACLVKLAEESLVRQGLALALSALGTRSRESELVGRVRRILQVRERAGDAKPRPWLLATAAATALLLAGFLISSPEFVRFDAMPSTLAEGTAGASLPPTVRPRMVGGETARPVLAKAFVYRPPSRMRTVSMVMPTRRVARLPVAHRVRALQGPTPQRRPAFQPAFVAPRPAKVPAHVVLTEFEFSQPIYAAVPLRDGWLILQL